MCISNRKDVRMLCRVFAFRRRNRQKREQKATFVSRQEGNVGKVRPRAGC